MRAAKRKEGASSKGLERKDGQRVFIGSSTSLFSSLTAPIGISADKSTFLSHWQD